MILIIKKKIVSKTLMAALGAASALAVATTANADTQVQVKAGDTVWNYAQEYKTTVNAIVQRNQLANPDVLQIGQTLIIPDSATSATSQADTTSAAVASIVNPLSTSTAASSSSTTAVLATSAASQSSLATSQSSTADSTVSTSADAQSQAGSATTTNNYTPASGTPTTYAANSAAAYQAMSSYTISYGSAQARTAAAYTPQTSSQSYSGSSATQATNTASQSTSTTTSSAVATAKSMIGVPYVWGGNTPSGFDCSGLVQYSYNLGSNYRTTYQQATLGQHKYDVENAQSGDLYFWGTESAPYHVAIAEGNGNYIQAPTPGQNVQEGNIQYYRPNYYISMNQ